MDDVYGPDVCIDLGNDFQIVFLLTPQTYNSGWHQHAHSSRFAYERHWEGEVCVCVCGGGGGGSETDREVNEWKNKGALNCLRSYLAAPKYDHKHRSMIINTEVW